MSIHARISPLATPQAGCALLQVRGWEYDNGALEFAIQRNQDDHYLQSDRQWGNAPCWFAQAFSENSSEDSLFCTLGPDILDPLLESAGSAMFNFRLRNPLDGDEDENPLKLLDGLLPSSAGGSGVGAAEQVARPVMAPSPAVEPVVEPVLELPTETLPPAAETVESTIATSEPVIAQPEKKSSRGLLIGLLLALLLIAAGLVAWWLLRGDEPPQPIPAESEPVPASAAPEVQAAAPCSAEAMATDSELVFVQSCIREGLDSSALLAVIEQAKAAEHCGIAQRLYANRAQAGDLLIARAYAREYDPQYHQPSACFSAPDPATAAYWYETILGNDPDDAEASQRFEELKP